MEIRTDNSAVIAALNERIAELESQLMTADSIIAKTANNILDLDNSPLQEIEAAEECWESLKAFALAATGGIQQAVATEEKADKS